MVNLPLNDIDSFMTSTNNNEASTEEKIKKAADTVFTRKGYAATRTREIAEEAGTNVALLNYYFRSKENLFHLIMKEKVVKLSTTLFPMLNSSATSLDEKIQQLTNFYIDTISQDPNIAIFILSEIRNNPGNFSDMLDPRKNIFESYWVIQLREQCQDIEPIQLILSIMGMIIFPFIAFPVIEISGMMNKEKALIMLEDRKRLIPVWVKAIFDAS